MVSSAASNTRDLIVAVRDGDPRRVRVEGPDGTAAEADLRLASDLSVQANALRRAMVQRSAQRLARDIGAVELGDPPQASEAMLGEELFRGIFADPRLRGLYAVWRAGNDRLRLRVRVPASLAWVPWELLRDPDDQAWLALTNNIAMLREVDSAAAAQPSTVGAAGLHILGVGANPIDLPQLDIEHERRLMERVMRGSGGITWASGDTDAVVALIDDRRRHDHVFHFAGHGSYSDSGGALYWGEGLAQRIDAQRLATLLARHPTIRLAVLNACNGATTHEDAGSPSIANVLVQRGVPAVLAMQAPILDSSALDAARSLYSALSRGAAIDDAVSALRRTLHIKNLDWASPVLTVASADPPLFRRSASRVGRVRLLDAALSAAAGLVIAILARPHSTPPNDEHGSTEPRTVRNESGPAAPPNSTLGAPSSQDVPNDNLSKNQVTRRSILRLEDATLEQKGRLPDLTVSLDVTVRNVGNDSALVKRLVLVLQKDWYISFPGHPAALKPTDKKLIILPTKGLPRQTTKTMHQTVAENERVRYVFSFGIEKNVAGVDEYVFLADGKLIYDGDDRELPLGRYLFVVSSRTDGAFEVDALDDGNSEYERRACAVAREIETISATRSEAADDLVVGCSPERISVMEKYLSSRVPAQRLSAIKQITRLGISSDRINTKLLNIWLGPDRASSTMAERALESLGDQIGQSLLSFARTDPKSTNKLFGLACFASGDANSVAFGAVIAKELTERPSARETLELTMHAACIYQRANAKRSELVTVFVEALRDASPRSRQEIALVLFQMARVDTEEHDLSGNAISAVRNLLNDKDAEVRATTEQFFSGKP